MTVKNLRHLVKNQVVTCITSYLGSKTKTIQLSKETVLNYLDDYKDSANVRCHFICTGELFIGG